MRRGLFITVLLSLIGIGTLVLSEAGHEFPIQRATLSHTIDQTGDSALILTVRIADPDSLLDSAVYADSIDPTGAGTKTVVKWTSPLTVRRIAIASSIDTSYTDTLIIDLGTNTDTIAYAVPQTAFTQASYIDTIVARFNALTETADTIIAHDSVTYIKLVGRIAQSDLEGGARWTLAFGTGSNNMSEGDSTFTTNAMYVDSMVAKINASATISDTVTAANNGDSVYTITGRPGYSWTLAFGDGGATHIYQDSSVTQAAATSQSEGSDTIYLPIKMYQNGWTNLWGYIIIHSSATTTEGYGSSDSGIIHLVAYGSDGHDQNLIIAADSVDSLPATLFVNLSSDTLFRGGLKFDVYVSDTATDAAGTRLHDVDYYFIVH